MNYLEKGAKFAAGLEPGRRYMHMSRNIVGLAEAVALKLRKTTGQSVTWQKIVRTWIETGMNQETRLQFQDEPTKT